MAEILCKGYTFDPETMKSSTCGTIGAAYKDGKKFFCKQFNNPVEPGDNGALSPRAMARNRKLFEEFRRRKARLNRTLRDISGLGGNIVCPIDEAVCDHHWTEFSEYIEGALPEKEYAKAIGKLDEAEKLLVLKIAIGALQTIHGQKIVHGDLKPTNIMLVQNDSGEWYAAHPSRAHSAKRKIHTAGAQRRSRPIVASMVRSFCFSSVSKGIGSLRSVTKTCIRCHWVT